MDAYLFLFFCKESIVPFTSRLVLVATVIGVLVSMLDPV